MVFSGSNRTIMEKWRPIKGYEGLYEISSFGRIKSLPRTTDRKENSLQFSIGRILKPFPFKKQEAYLAIDLMKNGKRRRRAVHQLVLETFVCSRPFPNWDAIHKDGNGGNNKLSNLKWGTKAENQQDRKKHGTDNYARKLSDLQKDRIGLRFVAGETATVLSVEFGIHRDTVYHICRKLGYKRKGQCSI